VATADNAANNANEAAAAAAADNDTVLPRSMLLIKEANSSKGDDNDAPIALLLARFIQNFCLRIDGPIVVAIVVVRRQGGHEPEVPRGGADGNRKRLGAGVLLLRVR
jgi:hypothetical protein